MPTVDCPACDADVHVPGDIELNDEIECEDCDAKLEVVGLDPIQLDRVEW
jgi:lysine biosynthesis protein LysW